MTGRYREETPVKKKKGEKKVSGAAEKGNDVAVARAQCRR